MTDTTITPAATERGDVAGRDFAKLAEIPPAGQEYAKRALLLDLARSVATAANEGLRVEHIVSVLVRLLAQEERLLDAQRANERSY